MGERLRITQGTDKKVTMRLKGTNGDPFDLTDLTTIQIIFDTTDRQKIVFTNNSIPSKKAFFKLGDVTFTAVTAGKNGNGIMLSFNGTDTIAEVVAAWNTANSQNQVTHNAQDSSLVPAAKDIRLTNGYDQYVPVDILGSPLLGKIVLTMLEKETYMLKTGLNQSFKILVDIGLDTGGDRTPGSFDNKLDVIAAS